MPRYKYQHHLRMPYAFRKPSLIIEMQLIHPKNVYATCVYSKVAFGSCSNSLSFQWLLQIPYVDVSEAQNTSYSVKRGLGYRKPFSASYTRREISTLVSYFPCQNKKHETQGWTR